MQHAIGDHALLADGHTAALVDPSGNVAWLCWPRIDSDPLFFAILDDARGGGFSVRPSAPGARVESRRYLERSLVLETVWRIGSARIVVRDALAWGARPTLIRHLRAEGGDIDVEIAVRQGDWGGAHPGAWRVTGNGLELGDGRGVAITAGREWEHGMSGPVCRFNVKDGAETTVSLGSGGGSAEIETTLTAWRSVVPTPSALPLGGAAPWAGDERGLRNEVTTSCAVLLGLHQRGGGIVAAPTTSLPQWLGSSRTWDYRYAWLRDSALAGVAMVRLGLVDAAARLGDFIAAVVLERGPASLVRVDGTDPPPETRRDDLAGHGGARPVRVGNAASSQMQLDVPGEVIDLASSLAAAGAVSQRLRDATPLLATWITEHWREPDHGIWEIRGAPRRYTHSLLQAQAGLLNAARLAESGVVAGSAEGWRAVAADIAGAARPAPGRVLQLRGDGGGADAALAMIPALGVMDAGDAAVSGALDAIAQHLDRGGLLDRYEGQPDGIADRCAPFVFPTFWLAAALVSLGRDPSRPLGAAMATRSALGLFGEVADPETLAPLGNFPQVQSHASFAIAVTRP